MITAQELYTILTDSQSGLNIPVAYGRFKELTPLPHIVYMGDGQDQFSADNTYLYKQNGYRIEYYFTDKNEAIEEAIETLLLDNGLQYSKSEDIYIPSEDAFEIYYQI